jgi:CP family cyanate transporter-like MFS transporter
MKKNPVAQNAAQLLIAVFAVAMVMRSPITGLSPLLPSVIKAFELSPFAVSLLTAIPLLALAIFAPLANALAKRIQVIPTLYLGILAITLGILLRSQGWLWALYAGTLLLGCGIATANVLLPCVVKDHFESRIPQVTALYVLFFGIGGALCSALALPIYDWFEAQQVSGWDNTLRTTALWCLLPLLLWLPYLRLKPSNTSQAEQNHTQKQELRMLTQPIAWQVSCFLGMTSGMNYIFLTWLPTLLIDAGFEAHQAGLQHGLLQLAGALPTLLLMPLLRRASAPRVIGLSAIALMTLSVAGLNYFSSWAWLWSLTIGSSGSAIFIIALSLIGLRTQVVAHTMALSAMAQFFGYLLAALILWGFGQVYPLMNHQTLLNVVTGVCLAWAVLGYRATQTRKIGESATARKPKAASTQFKT